MKQRKRIESAVVDELELFDQASSEASVTRPLQASSLRKNGHVMVKGNPCKIVEMSTSAPGKHGHAKVQFVGIDIFTGKKHEEMCPAHHNMAVPNLKRSEMILVNVSSDGFLTLMNDDGELRSDIPLPQNEAVANNIRSKFESIGDDEDILVTVLAAMGREIAVGVKTAK